MQIRPIFMYFQCLRSLFNIRAINAVDLILLDGSAGRCKDAQQYQPVAEANEPARDCRLAWTIRGALEAERRDESKCFPLPTKSAHLPSIKYALYTSLHQPALLDRGLDERGEQR